MLLEIPDSFRRSSGMDGQTPDPVHAACRWVRLFSPRRVPSCSSPLSSSLFLGTCNSAHVAEMLAHLTQPNKPVVGFRFNSIRIDYSSKAAAAEAVAALSLKGNKSELFVAVRLDICNGE